MNHVTSVAAFSRVVPTPCTGNTWNLSQSDSQCVPFIDMIYLHQALDKATRLKV